MSACLTFGTVLCYPSNSGVYDMSHRASGKSNRTCISMVELFRRFSDDMTAEAWYLAHRLRVALTERQNAFAGPLEADETYMGGKRLRYRALIADNGLASGARA